MPRVYRSYCTLSLSAASALLAIGTIEPKTTPVENTEAARSEEIAVFFMDMRSS
jgi:hypothetical protein